MRVTDAPHVDLGSFLARRADAGRLYRWLGYGFCAAAVLLAHDPSKVAALLVVVMVSWLMAWFRVVGALWRTSLVCAALICAVILAAPTLPRLLAMIAPGARP